MKHIAKDALSDLYITVTPGVNALTVLAEVDVTGYCESHYVRSPSAVVNPTLRDVSNCIR